MFDPEKVDRFSFEDGCAGCCGCTMSQNQPDGDYVDSADYDQLLSLYREQMALIERIDKECLIGCLSLPSVRKSSPAEHT